ncbi:MAG: hypothetical protein ABR992_15565 [Solirubrobacteraceae bacterium]
MRANIRRTRTAWHARITRRVGFAAITAAIALGGSLVAASPAAACFDDVNETHCYAISEWSGVSIKETLIDAHTSEASVPEAAGDRNGPKGYEPPREQDEQWSAFPSDPYNSAIGSWIEVGDTTGYVAKGDFSSVPIYFEADESWSYPKYNYPNFNEVNYPESPGSGWWDATTYTENSGSWCATFQGAHTYCFGGLIQYANHLQDGLEYAANNDPERDGGAYARNQGQVIGYATNSSNQVTQWTGGRLRYADEAGDPWPPAGSWGVCGNLNALGQGNGAITVEAPAWLDWPECNANAEYSYTANVAVAPKQVAAGKSSDETLAAFGAPEPTAPPFLSRYKAPAAASATLSAGKLDSLATEVAASYGESSPERTQTVEGATLKSALAVAVPGVTPPEQPSPGISEWEQSSTDVITMDGEFSLGTVPRPAGEQAPKGQVLSIVVDAHTGVVDAISLTGSAPNLAELGVVRTQEAQ